MHTRTTLIFGTLALALFTYLYFWGRDYKGDSTPHNPPQWIFSGDTSKISRIELTTPQCEFIFTKNPENADKNADTWLIESPLSYPADPAAITSILSEIDICKKEAELNKEKLPDLPKALKDFGLDPPKATIKLTAPSQFLEINLGNQTVRPGKIYARLKSARKDELVVLSDQLLGKIDRKPEQWRSLRLLDLEPTLVQNIQLRHAEKEKKGDVEILKEKNTQNWEIIRPITTRADSKKITDFLNQLNAARIDSFLSATGTDSSSLGLASPILTLELQSPSTSKTLIIGAEDPALPGLHYAKFQNGPVIFRLPQIYVQTLSNLLDDVRDRRITAFSTPDQVTSLSITSPALQLNLTRKRKDSTAWKISNYHDRPASILHIQEFLFRLQDLHATEFLGSSSNPDPQFGFEHPHATLQLSLNTSPQEQSSQQTILLGNTFNNATYLKSSDLPFIVTIPTGFLNENLQGKPWDWFSEDIFPFSPSDLTSLSWKTQDHSLTFRKTTQGWQLDPPGPSINNTTLQKQISLLSTLKAERWVGPASNEDFLHPPLTLTLTFPSGQTTLTFGKRLDDASVLAQISGDNFAFVLPITILRALEIPPLSP